MTNAYDQFLPALIPALQALKPAAPVLLVVLGLQLARLFYERYKRSVKGALGEALVNGVTFRRLDAKLYRGFGDVYLPRPEDDGTTQVDHVVVSPYGIFVIETKNMAGWIYGGEHQSKWTQVLHRRSKHSFQNPIWQNKLHIRALAAFLQLPEGVFHNVVFFCGESTFKSVLPEFVINCGLTRFITRRQVLLLSAEQVAAANAALAALVAGTVKRVVQREHVAGIERRVAARA